MKKFLLLVAMATMAFTANAQQHKVFCELVGIQQLFSKKVTVAVDFGQKQTFGSNNQMVDETGNKIVFNSMVDAMNFMGELGWEFEQAYVVTIGMGKTAQNVYHWLLSRDIDADEEIIRPQTKSEYKKETKETY